MKKLFTLCSILLLGAVNVFAQDDFVEEDMTHYIVNAGFDEDLTFQADGSYKEGTVANETTPTLSNRSWSYIHPDGTCYAHSDSRSPNWKGTDGRSWATNGYIGQIKGWECTRTDYPKCEWVYFGVLPYDLAPTAIPVADDGTTFQNVPARPDVANGTDNKGAIFLRAGWGGECSYKQVVKLPCATYRLEYWSINVNANTTGTANDLTKITCRKDVFKDESGEGLNAKEWTKHEFEFTPTSEFTMEIGYQSAGGGSGAVPHVFIDGIKLVKIGEADKEQLLESDFMDISDSLYARFDHENMTEALSTEIYDAIAAAEEYEDVDELEANINSLKAYLVKVDEALVEIGKYNILTAKIEEYLESANPYPGASALEEAYVTIGEKFSEATIEDYAKLTEELNAAVNAYLFSQEATMDNPADYTFMIKNPNFVTEGNDPTYDAEGIATYPNAFDDYNTIATKGVWYSGSNTDGDQRLNNAQGRICWNLWSNSASTNVNDRSINQDLTGLPSGYYSVSADFITQPDWVHEAHAFAKNSHSDVSSPFLTVGTWTDAEPWGAWTTLKTGTILVADGKLTIGGRSLFPEGSQKGWFCMTNVKLYYHGPIDFEDYKKLYDEKIAALEAMCDTMVYAADKAAFADSIAAAKGATTSDEITEKLAALGRAQATAQASIDKWVGVNTGSWANLKDSIAAGIYTTEGTQIAQKVVDLMAAEIYAADATYTTMDALTAVLRKYRDSYLPALTAAQAKVYTVAAAQEVLNATIALQAVELTDIESMPTEADMDSHIANLNAAIKEANRLEFAGTLNVVAGADMTGFIVNPTIEGSATGWTVDRPVGDGPAKNTQQFDGNADGYYIDSWNATAGNLRFTAYQTLTNIPNGRYEIKAMTRTSGDGVYMYGIADNDTATITLKHFPKNGEYNYTQNIDPTVVSTVTGNDSIYAGGDMYGEIWQTSVNWVTSNLGFSLMKDPDTGSGIYDLIEEYKLNNEGNINEETMYHLNVVAANEGNGRGWAYNKIEIEVKDHVLTLGVTSDSVFTQAYKDVNGDACVPFNGTWISADNFTLTLLTPGDNTGWNPTATGIESVVTPENVAVRVENGAIIANGEIYSISGARVANGTKVPAGVYIVRQGKIAKKVLVK